MEGGRTFHFLMFSLPFPKPKSPNTPDVRKIKKRRGILSTIVLVVALTVGTYMDDSPETVGMEC